MSGEKTEKRNSLIVLKLTMESCSPLQAYGIDGKIHAEPLVQTCSILTTSPNAVTRAVHDRMPVILNATDFDLWLDPGMKNVAGVLELLKPYDAHLMRCYPVSHRVNNVLNDDEACSEQVNPAIVQDHLFL